MKPANLAVMAASFDLVELRRGDVLIEPDQPIETIVFPETGIVSVVAVASDDQLVEIGIFGHEGMSDGSVLVGIDRIPYRVFVQASGVGYRINAATLCEIARQRPAIRDLLLRWEHVFTVQTAYTALANGRGTIEARLARWLLMCHDRTGEDRLLITHEFLGTMLAVRRSGVTDALNKLKHEGLIATGRGTVTILDRPALVNVAGTAYGRAEAEYERILGNISKSVRSGTPRADN